MGFGTIFEPKSLSNYLEKNVKNEKNISVQDRILTHDHRVRKPAYPLG